MKKNILITALFIFAIGTICVSVAGANSIESGGHGSSTFNDDFRLIIEPELDSNQSDLKHEIQGHYGPLNTNDSLPMPPAVALGIPC